MVRFAPRPRILTTVSARCATHGRKYPPPFRFASLDGGWRTPQIQQRPSQQALRDLKAHAAHGRWRNHRGLYGASRSLSHSSYSAITAQWRVIIGACNSKSHVWSRHVATLGFMRPFEKKSLTISADSRTWSSGRDFMYGMYGMVHAMYGMVMDPCTLCTTWCTICTGWEKRELSLLHARCEISNK